MKKIYSIVLCLGLLIGFVACDGDKEFVKTECVITSEQIDVSQQSATITSIITTEATAIEVNLQYAITSNFADYQSVKMKQSGEKYVAQLVNLQENTTYYIRYVASNAYSSMIVDEKHSFTTKQTSTHEYVDLGLSVKWATCNIGANSPEEYGDYFAWGEIAPKVAYSWSTYKWCNGSETTLTKYCTDGSYGTVDNKTQLELSDDAAYANWGNGWRMPTRAELTELHEQCTWTWTTQNGVCGYKVTSKKSGYTNKSIFFPLAGYREDWSLTLAGGFGYYLSSSLSTDSPVGASLLFCYEPGVGVEDGTMRYYGLSVRPVYGEYKVETMIPTVTTAFVTQITETSAVAGGNVMSDGNASVTERGVVYSKNPNPVITNLSNTIRPCGSGIGEFTYTMSGLQPNTTYYVRAYAKNDVGTAYGEEVSFMTLEEVSATPEYVDLGLSVKWATCNIGANSPEEYGDYFAWGEIAPKEEYSWSTYTYCNGSSSSLTKYNYNSSLGFVDNKTQLELSDDAARANWGGKWRMPTDAELTELREQCTWTWTTENGINGYKVTSRINGKSIFLPAAGNRTGPSLGSVGDGYYWSSSISTEGSPVGAYYLYFLSGSVNRYDGSRDDGQSVRPVCP